MWLRTCFALAWVSQVCTQATRNLGTEKYIFGPLHNSILLSGNVREIIDGQKLQWSFIDRSHKTLILYHPVGVAPATLTSFYQHRSTYHVSNGSLELHRLEMADSGVYQLTILGYYSETPSKLFTYLVFLDVEEMLSTPLIVQDPTYVVNSVELSCIVRNGRPRKLLWWKGNEQVINSSFYTLGADNSTLSIKNVRETHCGFYTCTVMNEISQRNISHFLIVNGIQFLHKRILVTSVVALVSMTMSFAAICFIIFFGLEKYKASKYQDRLTIAFLLIEMKCYVCLLVASALCAFDADFFIVYRVISGTVCCLLLGMTGYIVFLYLRPNKEDISLFLLNKRDRYIVLGSGVFTLMVSPLPIYEAHQNVRKCTLPFGDVAAAITTAVMVYLSAAGLCFIFAIKYMQTWNLEKRSSRLWTR